MNDIERFFDGLAANWDEMEEHGEAEKRALLSLVGLGEGDKVLDVACGTGVITGYLREMTKSAVRGIDISAQMIERAKAKYDGVPGISFAKRDFYEEEGQYDAIVVYNAFPHFLDVSSFAKKAASLLKQGGRLAILHSLGREELSAHHSGKAHPYSRDLDSPQEEYRHFETDFALQKAEESPHHYALILTKK